MIYRIQSDGGDLWWEGWARNREDATASALKDNEGDADAIAHIKECQPYPMFDHTISSKHEDHRDGLD